VIIEAPEKSKKALNSVRYTDPPKVFSILIRYMLCIVMDGYGLTWK
jgi:hypothetical protein